MLMRVQHSERASFESFLTEQVGTNAFIRDMTDVLTMISSVPAANRSSYLVNTYLHFNVPVSDFAKSIGQSLDAKVNRCVFPCTVGCVGLVIEAVCARSSPRVVPCLVVPEPTSR